MSRGPGVVQCRIKKAFEAEPVRRFTIEELAGAVYHGAAIGPVQKESVRRALKAFNVTKCRVGSPRERGWRHVVSAH